MNTSKDHEARETPDLSGIPDEWKWNLEYTFNGIKSSGSLTPGERKRVSQELVRAAQIIRYGTTFDRIA